MSRYEFEDKNCVVYADERFGEIRTVRDENGERRYVGIDIADCMGFEAPNKAVVRSKIPGKMIKVPWVSGNRRGETNARCFNKKEAEKFIKNGMLPPKGFKDWFTKEVATEECGEDVAIRIPEVFDQQKTDVKNENLTLSGVFARLDEIVLEIMVLKKELAGTLEKTT